MGEIKKPPMDAKSAIRDALIALDGRPLGSLTYNQMQRLLARIMADIAGSSRDDPAVRLYVANWFHEQHGNLLRHIRLFGLDDLAAGVEG
jgi:hypothetical protein